MKRRPLLAAPLALSSCALFRHRKPPPPPVVRYQVGEPYQAGGLWRYPQASFDYDATGLAETFGAHAPLCADGAPFDPAALIAAHSTLQLPCVAEITNLETGRTVAVRIDDRGPASPARLLALTPRAVALLGPGSTAGVLRVRVRVIEGPSRALADALGGAGPLLPIAAAPAGTVQASTLAPPPGIAASGRSGGAGGATQPPAASLAAGPAPPLRLPEAVTQGVPDPGVLMIDCGAFGQPRYALALAARLDFLGAVASTSYAAPRDRAFRVRIGPLASVAEADATLDRALRAGVVDARIVIDQGLG